jgi:serine/threonine-protein kinase
MDVPQKLGKYEIRGVLGRGAMGVVYDGWDPSIARRVAIKSLPLPTQADAEAAEAVERFRREAQAAGRLTHPNIVSVFDYGETADAAYIVMEFVDGPTLKSLLDKRERFPLDRIRRIMADVLAGLGYSHAHGVVHRDIKPGNVMLASDGRAKIADFGIALVETSTMTQAGTVLGTPAYMSPEQFRGEPLDKRTDVYSAGVLLYQLLSGKRPFEGGLTAVMHKALNSEPPPPSELLVTAPPALDAVVRRAMAKRPQDRFASAEAFANAVDAALDNTIIIPGPSPDSPGRPRRWWLAGGGAAVIVALAGAGWFLTRPAPPAPAPPPNAPIGNQVPPPASTQTPTPTQALAPGTKSVPPLAPEQTPPTQVQPPPTQVQPPPASEVQPITPPVVPPPSPPAHGTTELTPPVAVEPLTFFAPALLEHVNAALHAAPCALAGAAQTESTGPLRVFGAAGDTTATALHDQISGLVGTKSWNWEVNAVDPVYCPALALLHPISVIAGAPGPGVGLTLDGDRTVLREDDYIRPRITMPDFAGEVRVDYLVHDGTFTHLYPSVAEDVPATAKEPAHKWDRQPSQRLAAGARFALGDPGLGKPRWQSGPPYGIDMIIAVASSTPLRVTAASNYGDKDDPYLADLARAIEQARAAGARVSGALLLVDVTP